MNFSLHLRNHYNFYRICILMCDSKWFTVVYIPKHGDKPEVKTYLHPYIAIYKTGRTVSWHFCQHVYKVRLT